MKYVLIFCAILIAGSIVLSKYLGNQRFQNPSPYDYATSEDIDVNYHDPSQVEAYYIGAQELGLFARQQWFNHKIDVRHPNEKKQGAIEAARKYAHELGQLQALEKRLLKSAALKAQGYTNAEVHLYEQSGQSKEAQASAEWIVAIKEAPLQRGDRGQLVLEVQQLLQSAGDSLRLDGIFDNETELSVIRLQEKHGLFPSGIVDVWLLNKLLD